ncbi:unnamed protein product [Brachionus calyciflorus]|uniref:Transmembrane protein 26 n=1 Tax=Brachionus calyciflorus TaxID=104777 RepID=A0A813V8R1_9BILA|nr:unnamed protein product [Brachionus calyciflorus]
MASKNLNSKNQSRQKSPDLNAIILKKSIKLSNSVDDEDDDQESIDESKMSPQRQPFKPIKNIQSSAGISSITRNNFSSTNVSMQKATCSKTTRKEDFQIFYQKCMRGLSHSINIIKALVMRLVFSLHSLIAIIYVYLVKQDEWYFMNFVGVVFLLIELFITIIRRKGREPRWFFPCFFIYICTMIPPIWFVELTRIEQANAKRRVNQTDLDPLEALFGLSEHLGIDDQSILSNAKNLQQLDIATIAVSLEISLLMLVILGRWFLPKGNISRSTLSQLLLVYMSLASDIVDLLSLLNETQVQESSTMPYFTLAIFSWSLFQFSLNLVVTRGRSFQSATLDDVEDDNEADADDETSSRTFVEKLHTYAIKGKDQINPKKKFWLLNLFDMLDTEMWSILITLIFQDGPFFALRITAVFKYDVRTFVTMFFTCKNAIILFLQFYRLSAICTEAKNNETDAMASNKADAISSLNQAADFLDKYVVLSYAQNVLIKKSNDKNKNSQQMIDEVEKRIMSMSPIILRSTLSKMHSYAVVLTPNLNLTASCCECDCHIREYTNVA